MSKFFTPRPALMWGLGLTMGLLVGVGMLVGALVARPASSTPVLQFPETLLHASGSHSGESFAMATGMFDEQVEGLFMLDYLTGDLNCSVLTPQVAAFTVQCHYNVCADLGVEQGKKPNFVMVTGVASFRRGSNMLNPASSVVYIADANSGNFAAYGVVYNATMLKTGTPQKGTFKLLGAGKARALAIRE
jgi:hypothetical protein